MRTMVVCSVAIVFVNSTTEIIREFTCKFFITLDKDTYCKISKIGLCNS